MNYDLGHPSRSLFSTHNVEQERQTERETTELVHHFVHAGGGRGWNGATRNISGFVCQRGGTPGGNPGFRECSCCYYPPPLCVQGRETSVRDALTNERSVQGTLRQRKIVQGTPWITTHLYESHLFSQGNLTHTLILFYIKRYKK